MAEKKYDAAVGEYLAECNEISERVATHLRTLEKGGHSAEVVDSLYRDIHTLKGSSQLFGFRQIGELTHAMENNLEPFRKQKINVKPEMLDVLLKCLDLIDLLIRTIEETGKEADSATQIAALIQELGQPGTTVAVVVAAAPTPSIPVVGAPGVAQQIVAAATAPVPDVGMKTSSAGAPAAAPESAEQNSSIRVPVSLLDKLMNLMGEMVLVRNQVLQYASKSDHLEFLNLSQRLDVVTSEIQGEIMKTRMQPIGSILSKFHRVTRDLAKELDKKIELVLEGTETELDKTLLETVKDPIMHIVRNSCDHGLETVTERSATTKDATGRILIRSYHEGGQVIVEISDDGRGLDRTRIIAKAVEKGLITTERASTISERDAYALIFAPGFSTAAAVTNVSGRGVGMDVVKNNIESIGGIVEVQSQLGKGTTTRLKIPLTLAIVPAMIVRCGAEQFAIPQVKLVELVRVEKEDEEERIERLHGKPIFRLRGSLLPLLTLSEVLETEPSESAVASGVSNIVVLNAEGVQFGLIVDEVQDTAEVVVKPLSAFLKALVVYSGATVLGDGSVALILDINGIAHRANLQQDANKKLKDNGADDTFHSEDQEFLLFRLNTPTRHAIPLNLVHRLEEFKNSDIEYSGAQRFVRYRNSALPIVSLNERLGFESSPKSDSISVIVTTKSSKMFGIEVDEIFDVLTTNSQLESGFQPESGIFGNVVTANELIVVVDTMTILDELMGHLSPGGSRPALAASASSGDFSKPSARILFAEDTAFFRRIVTATLESAGYIVTGCEHGLAAYEVLQEAQPNDFDLILSDIEMPKMNGLEFAKAVRALDDWKDIPMVALTTKFNADHIEEGKQAGFTSYMEKLKAEMLLEELRLLLKSSPRRNHQPASRQADVSRANSSERKAA